MTRPALELADVFRRHGDAFLDRYGDGLSHEQRRVLQDVTACRTAALGGHVEECDRCGHRQVAYNSCRNRHCPKCQANAAADWMEAREAELLPTGREPHGDGALVVVRVRESRTQGEGGQVDRSREPGRRDAQSRPPEIRPLESRVPGNSSARFGEGRMEKDSKPVGRHC